MKEFLKSWNALSMLGNENFGYSSGANEKTLGAKLVPNFIPELMH